MLKFFKILKSVILLRCPACFKGHLFKNPHLFNLKEIADMPACCPNCRQDFVVETEFYYGAMFVSYALTALLMFLVMGLDILFTGYLYFKELLLYIGLLLLGWTYWFRVSRAIWLAFYIYWLQPYSDKN
ncbi:DUF983 domain-containing protein [Sphingobacteriales bacterium UPWRP_1]|nr:hypothetical protein BVG80_03900 [Sphingobacteriales bacterium TSM_CSM]PSJ75712.1 DUF983 domain-containing protein [Sphingobacteriales bacterium UPWRP_1]